jgi:hypothetical protein
MKSDKQREQRISQYCRDSTFSDMESPRGGQKEINYFFFTSFIIEYAMYPVIVFSIGFNKQAGMIPREGFGFHAFNSSTL